MMMSEADKFLSLQMREKRYHQYQQFLYCVMIVVAVSVIAVTEFTSVYPDHLLFLIAMTVIEIISCCYIFALAGIRAGIQMTCKLFKELE